MPNLSLVPQSRREFLLTAALALPALRLGGDPRLRSLTAAVRGPVITRASASYNGARLIFDSLYDGVRPLATLNGTLCAMTRTIVALLENHQRADGSVRVPAALQPSLGRELLRPL